MDRSKMSDNDLVRSFVREHGARFVEQLVKDEYMEVQGRMNQYELPSQFSWFDDNDWNAYGGCSRFADGVEPVIGEMNVEVDVLPEGIPPQRLVDEEIALGEVKNVLVMISADEQGRVKAVDGFYLGAGTLLYLHTFENLHAAVAFHRLVWASKIVRLSDLLKLGFVLEKE